MFEYHTLKPTEVNGAMDNGSIYYLIPDLFQRSFSPREFLRSIRRRHVTDYLRHSIFNRPRPVGGLKIHYQHCVLLSEAGFRAHPLLIGDHDANFFGHLVENRTARELGHRLPPEDIVVATEFLPYQGLAFECNKRVLFVQNWINLSRRLKPEDRGKSYLDLGYDRVITCSDYVTRYVEQAMGIKATTIPNAIDLAAFRPDEARRRPLRVLALPRKNPDDLRRIRSLVAGAGLEFRLVNGLSQRELIAEYQAADIFLATGYPEGFGLPPLEAMACGCAVVGFTGGGASEYMRHRKTALVAADGDTDAAARLLELHDDPALKERLREQGLAMARTYRLERLRERLLAFYRQLTA